MTSLACQCSIIGDFQASPIPTLFQDLHSEISSGHGDPPPLKSCSSDDSSFVSCWDGFTLVEAEVLSVELQGGKEDDSEVEDEETGEEAWEDVGEGSPEGSVVQGEGSA